MDKIQLSYSISGYFKEGGSVIVKSDLLPTFEVAYGENFNEKLHTIYDLLKGYALNVASVLDEESEHAYDHFSLYIVPFVNGVWGESKLFNI